MITTFPFSDDSVTVLPLVSFKVISGTFLTSVVCADVTEATNSVAARINKFFIKAKI